MRIHDMPLDGQWERVQVPGEMRRHPYNPGPPANCKCDYPGKIELELDVRLSCLDF